MTYEEQKALIERRMLLLEAALKTSPKNCHEVAALVGSAYAWAYENLRKLHEIGSIYIVEYRRINRVGPATPYYAWRTNWRLQNDAPKPVPATKYSQEQVKAQSKARWARLKADPAAYAKKMAEQRARRSGNPEVKVDPPTPQKPQEADSDNPWNNLTMRWG